MDRRHAIITQALLDRGVNPGDFLLIGIRDEENPLDDKFNDILGFITKTSVSLFAGTTDPSVAWTVNPITYGGITGAARLCLGYHEDIWMIGVHRPDLPKFAHEAFIQVSPCKIARDVDKDYRITGADPIQTGLFGINMHRAFPEGDTPTIGLYSAGCQVHQNARTLDGTLAVAKGADRFVRFGASAKFSYYLFNKTEIEI